MGNARERRAVAEIRDTGAPRPGLELVTGMIRGAIGRFDRDSPAQQGPQMSKNGGILRFVTGVVRKLQKGVDGPKALT